MLPIIHWFQQRYLLYVHGVQLDKSIRVMSESWYIMIFLLRVFQYAELYRSTDRISLHDSKYALVLVQNQ
jgi:hypothetical protein